MNIELDPKILAGISELGEAWATSPQNPSLDPSVVRHWEKVVTDWKNDKSMPLVVRKGGASRGSVFQHSTGREIIVSDNSFSQWLYYHVLEGIKLSLHEIGDLLSNKEIPFAFVIKKEGREDVEYDAVLGKYSLSKKGMKLCHIEPVGLRKRGQPNNFEIGELKAHFLKLANPRNMFLVPMSIGGLGEVKEFIDGQRARANL